MPQQRFFNWKEEDSTFLLSQVLTGIVKPGRYSGYDFNPTSDMNLSLINGSTAFQTREFDNTIKSISTAMTTQGLVVFEDEDLDTLPINVTAAEPRIDVIALTHSQTQTTGGALAQYTVIQGTPAAEPVKPALSNPTTQIEIGSLYLPANTTALTDSGVVWTQSKVSALETKADEDTVNTKFGNLDTFDNALADALGKALFLQDSVTPDSPAPTLPPILIFGGVNEGFTVNGGYVYHNGEILLLEDGYVAGGAGSIIVFDVVDEGGVFKIARPRLSTISDGDFDESDMKLLFDYIQEKSQSSWVTLSLDNNWETAADEPSVSQYNNIQFKAEGNRRYLRGVLFYRNGSTTSDVCYTLGTAPVKDQRFSVSASSPIGTESGRKSAYCTIKSNGNIELNVIDVANNHTFWLDGIVFDVD